MSTAPLEVMQTPVLGSSEIEKVLIGGDLAQMKAEHRVEYYSRVCASLGLNPLTQPFAYLSLSGKLTLYARKDAAEQLRSIRGISLKITSREVIDGMYVVTCEAATPGGRCDMATGVIDISKLQGEAKANAMMKAETKAKRRVTLSICGLGLMDETEVETVPHARKVSVEDAHSGKLLPAPSEDSVLKKGVKPAPKTEPPKDGVTASDLPIPEELLDLVAKLRAGDHSVIKIGSNFLQRELIEACGPRGDTMFMRRTTALREKFPKGTAIPTEEMIACWLLLYGDLETARKIKTAGDEFDAHMEGK